MGMLEEGRERGRRSGSSVDAEAFGLEMAETLGYALELYPTLGDADLAAAVRDYDAERLACEPDYTEFPEMIGLLDRYVGERKGFAEASGLDEASVAYQFSWGFFISRRINANHLSRYDLVAARRSAPTCSSRTARRVSPSATTAMTGRVRNTLTR